MARKRIADDDMVERQLAECRRTTRELVASSATALGDFGDCIRNTRERLRLSMAQIKSVNQLLVTVDESMWQVHWPPETPQPGI
jgi:hypothetical protein